MKARTKGFPDGFRWNMLSKILFIALFFLIALSMPVLAVERDSSGRIARSAAVKYEFKKSNPCPATGRPRGACPGYEIDHIVPLKHGGADATDNMQWLTVPEHKAKTKRE